MAYEAVDAVWHVTNICYISGFELTFWLELWL